MQSPNSVTTQAFDGLVEEISIEIGITDKRLYDILGRNNPYAKLWRILTPLGRLDFDRLLLVQADFAARVARIGKREMKPCDAKTHKELSDAMQSILDRKPKCERKQQILEAVAELYKQLALCDSEEV